MEAITRLRDVIQDLQPGLTTDEFNRRKTDALSILEAFAPNGHDSKHDKLSRREREVMTMILSGQRLKEIAAVLDISVKTVTTHRARLMRKLGVDDNLGLYRYGIRNGLISV
ncbi:MAG TPA: LuxR C-terminal-related transcriptional regulator [Thermoanaerobaculia bacterium]